LAYPRSSGYDGLSLRKPEILLNAALTMYFLNYCTCLFCYFCATCLVNKDVYLSQLKYKKRVYKAAKSLQLMTARKYAEINSKVSVIRRGFKSRCCLNAVSYYY